MSAAAATAPAPAESPTRRAVRRFLRHRLAVFGLVVVVLFVAVAILAPVIAPYDPLQTSWARIRRAPSWAHWMGTDENGRDVLSRVIWGARASLMAGVISVLGALVMGVPLGLLMAGPLVEHAGFPATATLYGLVGLACTLAILLRWRAHLWPLDAPGNGG